MSYRCSISGRTQQVGVAFKLFFVNGNVFSLSVDKVTMLVEQGGVVVQFALVSLVEGEGGDVAQDDIAGRGVVAFYVGLHEVDVAQVFSLLSSEVDHDVGVFSFRIGIEAGRWWLEHLGPNDC